MRFGIGTLPTASTVIQEGDQVFMLVTDEMIETVTKIVREHRRRGTLIMRVAIAGAGNVGRSIAAELIDNGHQVMLIERMPKMLRPERVPEAEWVLADACELASLQMARLETCDVVVAATGDDKVNLVRVAAREDRVRGATGWSPGSTGPRTSGSSPTNGAWTSRSANRGSWPRWSRRRSRSATWSG